jgi:hypothetical protein
MVMYLYVRSTSQEGGSLTLLACNPNMQIHDHQLSWLVLLTYKYMTTHSPGLVEANSVLLAYKYMTSHSPGLYS